MEKPAGDGKIWFGNCNDYIGGGGIVDPLIFLKDLIAKALKPGQKHSDLWPSVMELLLPVNQAQSQIHASTLVHANTLLNTGRLQNRSNETASGEKRFYIKLCDR
jgi:hypothetical protein